LTGRAGKVGGFRLGGELIEDGSIAGNEGRLLGVKRLLVGLDEIIVLAGLGFAGLAHDEAQVSILVVGEPDAACDDGPFDGVLAEVLFGAKGQELEQIVFHHSHRFVLFESSARHRRYPHKGDYIFDSPSRGGA
jgi:hypothetical protein